MPTGKKTYTYLPQENSRTLVFFKLQIKHKVFKKPWAHSIPFSLNSLSTWSRKEISPNFPHSNIFTCIFINICLKYIWHAEHGYNLVAKHLASMCKLLGSLSSTIKYIWLHMNKAGIEQSWHGIGSRQLFLWDIAYPFKYAHTTPLHEGIC